MITSPTRAQGHTHHPHEHKVTHITHTAQGHTHHPHEHKVTHNTHTSTTSHTSPTRHKVTHITHKTQGHTHHPHGTRSHKSPTSAFRLHPHRYLDHTPHLNTGHPPRVRGACVSVSDIDDHLQTKLPGVHYSKQRLEREEGSKKMLEQKATF